MDGLQKEEVIVRIKAAKSLYECLLLTKSASKDDIVRRHKIVSFLSQLMSLTPSWPECCIPTEMLTMPELRMLSKVLHTASNPCSNI